MSHNIAGMPPFARMPLGGMGMGVNMGPSAPHPESSAHPHPPPPPPAGANPKKKRRTNANVSQQPPQQPPTVQVIITYSNFEPLAQNKSVYIFFVYYI